MLLLYDLAVSSYGCKTRILLRHKKLKWKSLPPPDGYGSRAYCTIVPSGTIPALIHDDFTLSESDAIAEYLNDLQPEPPMLPTDIKKRASARAFSRFHDTRIEPLIRSYFTHVSRSTRSASFVVENTAVLQKRFYQFAKMVIPQPFLAGEHLCLADCGFVPSFAILRCLQPILNFKIKLPKPIEKYEMDLIAHPSVRGEYNDYISALNEWTKQKLSDN